MKTQHGLRALTLLFAFGASAATASGASDTATGLPLFPGTTQSMDWSNSDFCGSSSTGMNYSLNTNAAGVLDWYKGKLQGYRSEHVKSADGHVYDVFISGDGKKIVEVWQQTGDGNHKYFINLFYAELTPAVDPNKLYTGLRSVLPCGPY